MFLSTIVVYFQRSFSFCITFLISFRVLTVITITITGSAMTHTTAHNFDVYQPNNPKATAYYQCVENHFEELEGVWDAMYTSRLVFWQTYVMTLIYRYLDCGNLHMGFARVRCDDCDHEYLLAFSCKRRQFCPSCHQKRVVEYGEWLLSNVLKDVPQRQ
ncbi:transposase zinc-binding domain-containing protein [Desulfobacter vibrioformis]|uniref:transposase zinc-binding domain-containing protein n=1 Tax=Desulfobacter vibrioformis TaxID=34031 RepID=UPI000AB13CE2